MKRNDPMYCIATFDTTHMALRFEKICRAAGHGAKIVPVPRKLSTSCGLACRYPCESEEAIKQLAEEKHIEVVAYHQVEE